MTDSAERIALNSLKKEKKACADRDLYSFYQYCLLGSLYSQVLMFMPPLLVIMILLTVLILPMSYFQTGQTVHVLTVSLLHQMYLFQTV